MAELMFQLWLVSISLEDENVDVAHV